MCAHRPSKRPNIELIVSGSGLPEPRGWLFGYLEFEAAVGYMGIHRDHSPGDSIFPDLNDWQRDYQQLAVDRIHFRVALVDLGSLAIENLNFTQRRF
jgi:hypothetical protein